MHETQTEAKRNNLSRRESRLVEDALKYISEQPGFRALTRAGILALVAARVAADVPKVTKPNLLSAAEALGITLPGGRDDPGMGEFTDQDRALLEHIAEFLDDLAVGNGIVAGSKWKQYRADTKARTLFPA